MEDMIIEHDLVDIWHVRNPTDTRFSWRQNNTKTPLIQRRLDYWLISNDLQEDVESVEIIIYSKAKARKKIEKVKHLEESLRDCTTKCDNNPSKENLDELECLQAEYDQLYDYITQGAIIRSRATWYELGEKNNKYFLNLEKSNKKKSSVRKIFTRDGKLTNNPKKIMDELESFYADL